jgi:glutamate dehydrogenase
MTAGQHQSHLTQLLTSIKALVAQRLSGAKGEEANQFIERYFAQVDLDDLATRTAEDLYGSAMAHFAFAREYAGGAPKLRVYNPRVEEHGWASGNTVIEIVNDDMPFLVDSVTMEVNRQGYTLQLLVHPIFTVKRDRESFWQGLGDEGRAESYIHVEVERETDPDRLKALGQGLAAVLADVRAAVGDWPAMRAQMRAAITALDHAPRSEFDVDEVRAFCEWVYDNHFTFLGYRDYDVVGSDKVTGQDVMLNIVANSGLGILHEPRTGVSASFRELPAETRKLALLPTPLVLTKANSRSTVHRPGYLDYIGLKRFNAQGEVVGERRFIGLYTSNAYSAVPESVPLLRRKVAAVVERAGFNPGSHMGKNLITVLQTFPRDELFQISADELFDTAMGILRLGDRRKIRVFLRRDAYGRYYSILVYLPRELFNTENRVKVQKILLETLAGTTSEFTVLLSDVVLARIHLLIRGTPPGTPTPDARAIETKIIQALRRWEDDLTVALTQEAGEAGAAETLRDFRQAFQGAYREDVTPRAAVRDLAEIRTLSAERPMALSLYRPVEADERSLRLRVYRLGGPMKLSGSLPMLENMGVTVEDERSYIVTTASREPVYSAFGIAPQRVMDLTAWRYWQALRPTKWC